MTSPYSVEVTSVVEIPTTVTVMDNTVTSIDVVEIGVIGPQGVQGVQGETGPQGPQGPAGSGAVTSITATTPLTGGTITSSGSIGLDQTALSITSGQVTGLAASATTDTTNASNITSGTLAAARVATLNQNTTGTAASLSAALSTTLGGTGVTTGLTVLDGGNLTASTVTNAKLVNSSVTVNGSAISLGGSATVTAAPSGSAGGDLTGTFPNPTLVATGTAGTYTKVTTDSKGRVTSGTTLVLGDLPSGVALTGSANAFTVGGHTITNEGATVKSLILKGAASQTANLQEWQNSAGTALTTISSAGAFVSSVGGHSITQQNDSTVGLAIVRNSGSSTYLQSWNSTSSQVMSFVTAGGALAVRTFGSSMTNFALGVQSGADTENTVLVKSASTSMTADLLRFQTSANTVLGGRNANAQIFTGSTSPITSTVGGATTAASGTGTTATITTTTATNLAVGDIVVVAGVTPTGYNTTGSVVTAVSNTSPFTVSYANTTTGSQTVAGTVSTPAQASVTARSAGTKGLVVRAAASQFEDILQVQNSGGTRIAAFDFSGSCVASSYYINGSANILNGSGTGSGSLFRTFGATSVGLTVRNTVSGFTGDLLQLQNNSSVTLTSINASGTINFNTGNTSATATAGALTAPALVTGFITMQVAGTTVKVPYYSN